MDSGVARKPIKDLAKYRRQLSARIDPTASTLQVIFEGSAPTGNASSSPRARRKRSFSAALAFRNAGYGDPILVGREHRIRETIEKLGLEGAEDIPITNAKVSDHNESYIDFLYEKLQRRGSLRRDRQRMVNLDRNVFCACMVLKGHADAMVTGVTRSFKPLTM